jgi:outer membrane protein assembly factor BamE
MPMFAHSHRRPWLLFGALVATLGLGACSSITDRSKSALTSITPYRVEVVQGNFVSKEQVEALKPGMSRQQAREILGTSLLSDVFHADRWDYVFTIRRQGTPPQDRRVTLLFENEKLKSFDTGGELPGEREFVASIDTFKTKRNAPPMELTEAQLKALPAPKPLPVAVDTAASAPVVRTYPPLEAP